MTEVTTPSGSPADSTPETTTIAEPANVEYLVFEEIDDKGFELLASNGYDVEGVFALVGVVSVPKRSRRETAAIAHVERLGGSEEEYGPFYVVPHDEWNPTSVKAEVSRTFRVG